jgi:hypothetical protein
MKYISHRPPKREECDVSSGSQISDAPQASGPSHDSESKRTRHHPQNRCSSHVDIDCTPNDRTSFDGTSFHSTSFDG